MREAFSLNREFDYVRMEGLRRATGLPEHEWDLYIVKELVDNALDADDLLWHDNPSQPPQVEVRLEYFEASGTIQVQVSVANRARFPVEQLDDIFATGWYTSRKAFFKGLSRGALGNALKTLLGIPYALYNSTKPSDPYRPSYAPMTIAVGDTLYKPQYQVDVTTQTISFAHQHNSITPVNGTIIKVNLDHFWQERRRTLSELHLLADQYHLCNPHAAFHWTIEIVGENLTLEYSPHSDWTNKFQDPAPIQWYSPPAFQELLAATYRRQFGEDRSGKLSMEDVRHLFGGLRDQQGPTEGLISQRFSKETLTNAEIESPGIVDLYSSLYRRSPHFESRTLGGIGPDHVRTVLTGSLPLARDVFYDSATDSGENPDVPFVLEAAVAQLKEGNRRVWTAINFTPTYGEPFLRSWLRVVNRLDEPVLGLRGLLDAYGIREDTPLVLFLHLICPNVEHREFSKTEINHLPFKDALAGLLDRLLACIRQAQEDEQLRLEQTITQAINFILDRVDKNERFVVDQLIEKLRSELSRDPTLATWLETPEASGRLRTYVANYLSRNTVLTQHVARPALASISLPVHPDRHISVWTEHIAHAQMAQYHVNKLLYVQPPTLEPVVVENNWLCRMDMGLIRNSPGIDELHTAVVQSAFNVDVPILVLHNGDEAGLRLIDQMRTWLSDRGVNVGRIVDVGLQVEDTIDTTTRPVTLMQMMPEELFSWLKRRLQTLGIPLKSIPSQMQIRWDIAQGFDRQLKAHLWEGLSHHFKVAHMLNELDRQLQFTESMNTRSLDVALRLRMDQEACADSYAMVLDKVVTEFFDSIMQLNGRAIQAYVQKHIQQAQEAGAP
jgi:hypothetical protein